MNTDLEAVSWLDIAADISQLFFGAIGLIVGIATLIIAWRQILPLRRSIDVLADAERRRQRKKEEIRRSSPREPREVAGFDPRFSNAEWSQLTLLPSGQRNQNLTVKLSGSYDLFATALAKAPASFGVRPLVVDLALIPEYLENGTIAALGEANDFDFAGLIDSRARSFGLVFDAPVVEIMRAMCSCPSGKTIGALPLWINWQGRFFSLPSQHGLSPPLMSATSLEAIYRRADAADRLADAGIQIASVSSAAFEFWAHLAYRGCQLFHTSAEPYPAIRATASFETWRKALADYAVRLRYSNGTREAFHLARQRSDFTKVDAFEFGHADDARSMRDGAVTWKPVFSSELLPRTLPRRPDQELGSALADETSFRPPFARRIEKDRWRYLSALGGYGLALPKAAEHDADSIRALKYMFFSNPYSVHNFLAEAVRDLSLPDELDGFVQAHARPRWPFWSQAETIITNTLFDSLLEVNRLEAATPELYWTACESAMSASSTGRVAFQHMIDSIGALAERAGWRFSA